MSLAKLSESSQKMRRPLVWLPPAFAVGYPPCGESAPRACCEGEVVLAVVRMLFSTEARQRWRSWLLLGGLVALTTGLVLAGVSAGRRTAAAFPQLRGGPWLRRRHLQQQAVAADRSTARSQVGDGAQRSRDRCSLLRLFPPDQPGGLQSVRGADEEPVPFRQSGGGKDAGSIGSLPGPGLVHHAGLRSPRRDGAAGALLRPLAAGRTGQRPYHPAWADARPPCGRNRSV